MEIERKFLIDGFPDNLPMLSESLVYQGYIAVDPVVRIRSKLSGDKESYVLCFKGEGTLARQETEISLSKDIYEELKALLKYPMIKKEYKVFSLPGGLKLECNLVDQGTPTEFYYAEVEFDTIEQARNFQPPPFLGKEVTEDCSYSMGSYWAQKYLNQRQ